MRADAAPAHPSLPRDGRPAYPPRAPALGFLHEGRWLMLKRLCFVGLLLSLAPAAVFAAAVTTAGPRVGFSIDPDQLIIGGQLEIGEVAPKISFDPNLDLGFGDHET